MNIPENIAKLPIFDTATLLGIFPHHKISSLHQKIQRWKDAGNIIQLKKGLYTSAEYAKIHRSDSNFLYSFANTLYYPSYVSGAFMLQRYDMLTEAVYPITSVTLKSSRNYTNKIADFKYSSISNNLYTGYVRATFETETVYIASKAKALFDFFYFKYAKETKLPADMKERDRIEIEKLNWREKNEFKKYCKMSHFSSIKKLPYLFFHE